MGLLLSFIPSCIISSSTNLFKCKLSFNRYVSACSSKLYKHSLRKFCYIQQNLWVEWDFGHEILQTRLQIYKNLRGVFHSVKNRGCIAELMNFEVILYI